KISLLLASSPIGSNSFSIASYTPLAPLESSLHIQVLSYPKISVIGQTIHLQTYIGPNASGQLEIIDLATHPLPLFAERERLDPTMFFAGLECIGQNPIQPSIHFYLLLAQQ